MKSTLYDWNSYWSHPRPHYASPHQARVQVSLRAAGLLGEEPPSRQQQPQYHPVPRWGGPLYHPQHGHYHQQPLPLPISGLLQPLHGLCGDCRHSLLHLPLYNYRYGLLLGWVSKHPQMMGNETGPDHTKDTFGFSCPSFEIPSSIMEVKGILTLCTIHRIPFTFTLFWVDCRYQYVHIISHVLQRTSSLSCWLVGWLVDWLGLEDIKY